MQRRDFRPPLRLLHQLYRQLLRLPHLLLHQPFLLLRLHGCDLQPLSFLLCFSGLVSQQLGFFLSNLGLLCQQVCCFFRSQLRAQMCKKYISIKKYTFSIFWSYPCHSNRALTVASKRFSSLVKRDEALTSASFASRASSCS